MAHYATRRFNYWGQLGVLAGLCGAGLILGGIAMFIPMMGQVDVFGTKGDTAALLDKIMSLPNATAVLRWSQLIGTPFVFLLPAILYARICHIQPIKHMGFDKPVDIRQLLLVILIMIAATPAVSALQELTEMLPWSKAMVLKFKAAEDEYNRQVVVMAKMDGVGDYLISLFIIALLPAVFEEVMFRGCWQNLLSRWFKIPLLALIIMSALFSAVHGSYLGFLSRFALGFVLGWMYYRTGNIWLNIIAHFFNNAAAVTFLYFSTKAGEKIDPSKMEDSFPLWAGLVSIAAVAGLFMLFEKVSKNQIDRPGEEVLIPGYNFSSNPFINDIANNQ
jgi:uncharacterized protein